MLFRSSMIWNKEIGWFFFIGYVLQKYMQLPTVAIAIIAAVMAFVYFNTEKKINDVKRSRAADTAESAEEEDLF